jgi:hypothetical protein
MTRGVGNFWFTVEGFVDNGNNRYNEAGAILKEGTFLEAMARAMNTIMKDITSGSELRLILDMYRLAFEFVDKLYKEWETSALYSTGWYISTDRTILIKGGPEVVFRDSHTSFRYINSTTAAKTLWAVDSGLSKALWRCPYKKTADTSPVCSMSRVVAYNMGQYCVQNPSNTTCEPRSGLEAKMKQLSVLDKVSTEMDKSWSSHGLTFNLLINGTDLRHGSVPDDLKSCLNQTTV